MRSAEKILIVDDERFNLNALVGLLKHKYKTMVAKDGNRALKAATSAEPPELILLDIVMPGMDGYETIQRLKENEASKDIPVIFLTGKDHVEDEMKGLEMGAVDYITKPFHPAVILARVKTHLRLKHKIDLLEKTASLDGLTEIPNRRAFDETLNREWLRCRREGLPMTLLMMDIDQFKQYNDHYGHQAGDDCLVAVAQTLAGNVCRPSDFVARYGGEEFAVILPGAGTDAARIVGERIRAAVESLQIPQANKDTTSVVTISLGGATRVPDADGSPEAILRHADEQLYLAKAQGRNRLVVDAS